MSGAATPLEPGPIRHSARIDALDAARGLALLGIFCVNIQLFAQPFGELTRPAPDLDGAADAIAHYFVEVFCEGKFYPLFSAMFGMGLVLQMRRADAAGRRFGPLCVRRLGVLLIFGILHALLLWYGDILFYYAIAGTVLMLCARWSARALLTTGIVLACISLLLTAGFSAMAGASAPDRPAGAASSSPAATEQSFFDDPPPGVNAVEAPEAGGQTPFARLMGGFRTGEVSDPAGPLWLETEREAYREGPYSQVFLFRVMTWGMMILIGIMTFSWHILAMFFIGAAVMKAGVFDPRSRLPRGLAAAGLFLGLPLSIAGAALPHLGGSALAFAGAGACLILGGTLMALGYLGGVTLLARSGAAARLTRSLARVGRMALTNYLMQSLIATTVFYFYGLGLFGEFSRVERLGFVFGVYIFQHLFSLAWLGVFAMGPMEWVWRGLTYLRWPALLRRG